MKKQNSKEYFKRVGERIRFIREILGISAETLCERAQISMNQLEKWESGNGGDLSAMHMPALARALYVDVGYLFAFEIEESVPQTYLEFMLEMLPEDLRKEVQEALDSSSQSYQQNKDQ